MRVLTSVICFAVGCNNEAAVEINSELTCLQCAKPDLTNEQLKAVVIPQPEDIFKWSDGTWCYREELHQMTHMSDDYETLHVESAEWFDFLAQEGI